MRYILHPGIVCNNKDGDCHFITAQELAKLYGVKYEVCYVLDSRDLDTYIGFQERENDLHLYPRPDGNYDFSIKEDK